MFVVNYFVNAEDLLDGVIEDAQLQVNVGILGGVCVLKTDYFFKVKKLKNEHFYDDGRISIRGT